MAFRQLRKTRKAAERSYADVISNWIPEITENVKVLPQALYLAALGDLLFTFKQVAALLEAN